MASALWSIPVLFARTVLAPLHLAPSSLSAVKLEFSPFLTQHTEGKELTNGSSNGVAKKTEKGADVPQPDIADLDRVVKEGCPSLLGEYKPTPWLSGGHMQTIYCAVADFTKIDHVTYQRKVLITPDGGTLSLDITPPSLVDAPAEHPTIVCLHGLTGGSHESYVRNCFARLTSPKEEGGMGYRGVVVNFRGCANTPVSSPQLYSASKTSDLRSALLWLTHHYPGAPLIGLGFSLGANVLGKYLGEQGDDTPLRAGVVVGNPWDLVAGSNALESGLIMNTVYSKALAGNLVRVMSRHLATLNLHEPLQGHMSKLLNPPPKQQSIVERGVKPNTLRFVDDTLTRLAGGHSTPYGEFPFETADDYYAYGGSVKFLDGVRRPLLVLNSDDDPIVPAAIHEDVRKAMGIATRSDGTPSSGNPNIVLATTRGGGHLGWFEGLRPIRWVSKPICEFISTLFEHTESTDTAAKLGGVEKSLWKRESAVQSKEVEIELLPVSATPAFPSASAVARSTKKVRGGEAVIMQKANGNGNGHEKGTPAAPEGKMAWLRTKMLEHAPLVHPSAAPGWTEPASRETLKLTMYYDTARPEVGFAELPPDSRVGGVGDVFRGGIDTPGGQVEKSSGVIAGL